MATRRMRKAEASRPLSGEYVWTDRMRPLKDFLPFLEEGDLLNFRQTEEDYAGMNPFTGTPILDTQAYRVERDPVSGLLYGRTPGNEDFAALAPLRGDEDQNLHADRTDEGGWRIGIRIRPYPLRPAGDYNDPWNVWITSIFSVFREGYGDLEIGNDEGA